jgi:photosystem II stability/assembly factor-like uncharacterized protein
MRRTLVLLAVALFISAMANAQPYLAPGMLNVPAEKPKVTFYDVQRAFENYWQDRTPSPNEEENAEEGGYQQFKRWEAFMEQRTFPTGILPSPEILYNEFNKYKAAKKNSTPEITSANWSFIGPHVIPSSGGGSGRINCMIISPADTNTIWVGAACGGLWKTTDGGNTWTTNTDLLPSLSISDIVIDPTNPSIMYLATGDKYGIYYQYEVWGHYSAGVLKSTDGGATWFQTGLNYTLENNTIIQRLIHDSTSPNTLYAATNVGIYKTTDGGANWTNIRAGKYYDIEFKPDNHAIVYASDSIGFLRSTNSGGSFNYIAGINATGRSTIAVTPANPNVVYVWAVGGGFNYSNNAGVSFTPRANPSSQAGPYGYYDYVLDVSPVNENILFAGGLETARSTNGGTSWTTVSDWSNYSATNYVHADNHDLKFMPGSSTIIFSANDGGLFKSTNQGNTWTDLSGGIDIKQYYRITCSALTPYLMFAGAQDNGTDKITGLNTAEQVMGADGEDCLIDYTDDNIVFASSQGGNFYKSTDGGNSFYGINIGSGGDWTTPIIMDANNHNIMYSGYQSIYKSTDNGENWNVLPGSFDGTDFYSLEISNSNSQVIYAATFGNIYRTTNGGNTWTNITGSLPVGGAAISGIAINGSDPNIAWVTFSGFYSGQKVYMTVNGGSSWTNISGTLPNIPVNCVEYQNGSNDIVYIGTDLGMFYMDATMNDWVSYNTDLPNVIINDLEITYAISKIRAGTFGRGIWESDLQSSTLMALDAGVASILSPTGSSCDSIVNPIVRIRNFGVDTLISVDIHYYLDSQPETIYNWVGSLPSLGSDDIVLPTFGVAGGTHSFTAYTTDPNAGVDMNAANDDRTSSFDILTNPTGIPAPVTEGFVSVVFPPVSWTLENSSSLWGRSNTVGGYSLSTNSAFANFWSIQSGTDKIISANLDFANMIAPIVLTFDVAYAPFSATSYIDSLGIDVVTDCDPNNPIRVYTKGGLQLATAPVQASQFTPNASQWRTDTVDLSAFAGAEVAHIRFLAISGYGNYCYVDNINLRDGTTNVIDLFDGKPNVILYPNPASEILSVDATSLKGPVTINVYDIAGKEVPLIQGSSYSAKRFALNISNLTAGMYFVKITSDDGVSVQKVLVR